MTNTTKIMIGFGKKRFKYLHLTDEADVEVCKVTMVQAFKKASAGLLDIFVVDIEDGSVSAGRLREIRVRGDREDEEEQKDEEPPFKK